MRIEVTGCEDCPFNYAYDMANGYGCQIDSEKRNIEEGTFFKPITPEWCPLKKRNI